MNNDEQDVEELVANNIDVAAYDMRNPSDLINLFRNETEDSVKRHMVSHVKELIEQYKLVKYEVVFLYDAHFSISNYHSNKIYGAISKLGNKKDILLILLSDGGKVEPAYLISKTCKRLSKNKFVIAIPRKAKSAATLIALGGDELHMGLMSELGPIDPQFGGFPALGVANALERLASLVEKFPNSSCLFSAYLSDKLSLVDLGYLERINESAGQYAERLLAGKELPDNKTARMLATHFVNHYKDHGFVIDVDETSSLLGSNIVKEGTNEYLFANDLYQLFDFADFLFSALFKKTMRYIGVVDDGIELDEKKEEE